jgi:hypothetical protein
MRLLCILCIVLLSSCAERISDPTRPDIRKQAIKAKDYNLKAF